MDQQKSIFGQRAQDLATQAAQLLDQLAQLVSVWDDRLYGPGAANELTIEDLEGTVLTATPDDLYAFIIAASQLGKFMESDPASVPGPYSATINKLRRDM